MELSLTGKQFPQIGARGYKGQSGTISCPGYQKVPIGKGHHVAYSVARCVSSGPFDEGCAPRRLLRLFSGKWVTMILHTLRELEEMELVAREVHQVMPPVAEYRLTALGRKMVEPVEMLYRWGAEHAAVLDRGDAHVTRARKGAQGAV